MAELIPRPKLVGETLVWELEKRGSSYAIGAGPKFRVMLTAGTDGPGWSVEAEFWETTDERWTHLDAAGWHLYLLSGRQVSAFLRLWMVEGRLPDEIGDLGS